MNTWTHWMAAMRPECSYDDCALQGRVYVAGEPCLCLDHAVDYYGRADL